MVVVCIIASVNNLCICTSIYLAVSLICIKEYVASNCLYMLVQVLSGHRSWCHEVYFVRLPCLPCVSFKQESYLSVYLLRLPFTSCQRWIIDCQHGKDQNIQHCKVNKKLKEIKYYEISTFHNWYIFSLIAQIWWRQYWLKSIARDEM